MKNYLVIPVAKCNKSVQGAAHAGPNFYNFYEKYAEMQIKSAEKNLKGLDEVKIIDGEFESTEDLFEHIFHYVYDLAHAEECNILQAMADTLYIRETEIFGKYTDFSLFGLNPGINLHPSAHPFQLESVRYWPHAMESGLWEHAKKLWEEPILDKQSTWGYEMVMYTALFYKQRAGFYLDKDNLIKHLEATKHLARKMVSGYEGQNTLTSEQHGKYTWDVCSIESASILEFSATRGHESQLAEMQKYYNKFID